MKLPILAAALGVAAAAVATAAPYKVLFLPLDERFTTRFAVLNLAQVTPFELVTPPMSLLPSQKTPAPLDALLAWVDANIQVVCACVCSGEGAVGWLHGSCSIAPTP
jgi:hypothetical protein